MYEIYCTVNKGSIICVSLRFSFHFSFHLQRWAVVMEELFSTTSCVDDDTDGGYDSPPPPPPPEGWNDVCDEAALVMAELAHIRPLIQVNKARRTTVLLDSRVRSLPPLQMDVSSCGRCLLPLPLHVSYCRRCLMQQFNTIA